jgi:hypothetical protein
MCAPLALWAGALTARPPRQIDARMRAAAYSPRTWRTQPLHLLPPEPYAPAHPDTTKALDYIFLVSTLNFSFWSELAPADGAYAVEWRETWGARRRRLWYGYHALLAALDRCASAPCVRARRRR